MLVLVGMVWPLERLRKQESQLRGLRQEKELWLEMKPELMMELKKHLGFYQVPAQESLLAVEEPEFGLEDSR